MKVADLTHWTAGLHERIEVFLKRLQIGGETGRFRSCMNGATASGRQLRLGFSCLALKIHYMLGFWDDLEPQRRQEWIEYLQSFQLGDDAWPRGVMHHAFVDIAQVSSLRAELPWYRHLAEKAFVPKRLTTLERLLIAETKQTISTLAQVGARALRPFRGFPTAYSDVDDYLTRLDWSRPWSAGGLASALAVFFNVEAPRFLEPGVVQALTQRLCGFFESIADPQTGGYFRGGIPSQGQLINGAMKVLTALDWLGAPVHYPQRLVDTCLRELPPPEGCHMVDWVYVLYRCSQETEYRRLDRESQVMAMLEMIRKHHNDDGGFSSRIGKGKSHYYGVRISRGLPGSDIHGTCLLTWALAMILEIMGMNAKKWRVIKP